MHRRALDGVEGDLLDQDLSFSASEDSCRRPPAQGRGSASFPPALRGVSEIRHDVLDRLFHPVEVAEGRIDLDHLVGKDARQARVEAGIHQFGFADRLEHPLGGGGVGHPVGLAQFQVSWTDIPLPGRLETAWKLVKMLICCLLGPRTRSWRRFVTTSQQHGRSTSCETVESQVFVLNAGRIPVHP